MAYPCQDYPHLDFPYVDFPSPVFQTMDTMTLWRVPLLDFWTPVSLTFTGDEIHSLNNKK